MSSSTEMREHVQRLFFYDRWANASLLQLMAGMDGVPETAVERMNHIIAALELWCSRCSGRGNPPTDLFAPGWTIEQSTQRLGRVHDDWTTLLAPLSDADLFAPVHWTRLDGGDYQALLRDITTQLPLHAAYHRGQLSLMLKDKLEEPLDLDYIFTTWQPAESTPV